MRRFLEPGDPHQPQQYEALMGEWGSRLVREQVAPSGDQRAFPAARGITGTAEECDLGRDSQGRRNQAVTPQTHLVVPAPYFWRISIPPVGLAFALGHLERWKSSGNPKGGQFRGDERWTQS